MSVKFVVDNNVGKLARWLRMLGYDALFINPIADDDLVEIARKEGRVVLTKDTQIPLRRLAVSGEVRVVYVEGDRVREQLCHVVGVLGLDHQTHRFTRCLECNVPLVERAREDVQGQVPPYVFHTQSHFMGCPRCGRIYWPGTHWFRMRSEIDRLLGTRDQDSRGRSTSSTSTDSSQFTSGN